MSDNTWLHCLSRQMVLPLADTAVTPNHLTTARLVTGVAAALCFIPGQWHWNLCGALLFLLSMILDRADGELARIQSTATEAGAYYDLFADAVCNTLTFLALGIAAFGSFGGGWSIIFALLAGISISLIFAQIIFTEIRLGQGGGKFDSMAGFDADDAVIVVPVSVVAGYGEWLLLSAGIFAPVALFFISFKLHKRRRRP